MQHEIFSPTLKIHFFFVQSLKVDIPVLLEDQCLPEDLDEWALLVGM